MATIIGNLKPEDDYTHELGPESNFNESVYFNFFDPSQNRGGFVRIGNRANEGRAEMTVTFPCTRGSTIKLRPVTSETVVISVSMSSGLQVFGARHTFTAKSAKARSRGLKSALV